MGGIVAILFWSYLIILAVYTAIVWTYKDIRRAIDLRKDRTAWEQRKEAERQWKERQKERGIGSGVTWRWKLAFIAFIIAVLLFFFFIIDPILRQPYYRDPWG